jgi:hypothetical protein
MDAAAVAHASNIERAGRVGLRTGRPSSLDGTKTFRRSGISPAGGDPLERDRLASRLLPRQSSPRRQIRSLVLYVDLVGSRWIEPAHVGWLVGPDGSRRIQTDRLDDQRDDQSASDRELDGKASGTEREDRCGAEGDGGPRRRPMPSQGGLPPSGRNHLHRVKPVARTEAMIDRQKASYPEQERGRPPDTSA